ncbi:MAG: cobyrinate a,c-diamide synthase [Acidimicrobiales bacterium]
MRERHQSAQGNRILSTLGPRLVIAGTQSGVGKTTVATGIMAALRIRGMNVGAAKVGPDFIDTGYHRLAAGRASRNLDAWICGEDAIVPLAGRAAEGADLLVVEGVMGLFDGASEEVPGGELATSSTAATARELGAPVVLVVDASAMSQSIAALVHGYSSLRRDVRISAVILNRVGSEAHEAGLRRALEPVGTEVVGCLRRDDSFEWRDRHLGLIPVVEHPQEVERSLAVLAAAIGRSVDLEALLRLARSAAPMSYEPLRSASPQTARPVRVAVAGGAAFSFVYPDNLERLEEAGAEIVTVDPVRDDRLPEGAAALYAGGGFPEVFAEQLAANRPLLEHVRHRAAGGMPIWAECGGLLWLAGSLGPHSLAGVVPARGEMTPRLTLGYRRAAVLVGNPVAPEGASLRGHEFHYSACEPAGDALELSGRQGTRLEGFASPTMLATYLHLHLGSDVAVAERFVRSAVTASLRTWS